MRVKPGRIPPRQSAQKPAVYKTISIPAPTLGLVANENLASPQLGSATILRNFLPTATGAILRRGSEAYAQVNNNPDVRSLFTYVNGNNQSMFAAADYGIYDISSSVFGFLVDDEDNNLVDDLDNFLVDSSVSATVTGLSGGEWSSVQFATVGGVFLDLVNGADNKLIYDGSTFYPISGEPLNKLDYATETAAFTKGQVLTGGTSGASATIIKVIDNGLSGTLWLGAITSGPFQDGEAITDPLGGAAVADGVDSQLFGAMTGVDSSKLSWNWVYKSRLFYVEKDSLSAWYLPAGSITGAASELPLGSVFTLGGSLLFGSSWSLETGSGGLSEQCVFVTTEGEVAVFQGSDPANASTWSKVGIYRIGKPLGRKAHFRAGGDIVIATDIGLIPLSQALQKDFAVLSPSAVSAPIETIWNDEVRRRGTGWDCLVWSESQIAIAIPPITNGLPAVMYAANTRTGRWGEVTGWQANCSVVFQGRLFFGGNNGLVFEGNVTGADMGKPYTGIYVPMFSDFGAPGRKVSGLSRAVMRAVGDPREQLSMQADFTVLLPAPPNAGEYVLNNVWGGAIWGESTWGGAAVKQTFGGWQSTPLNGDVLSPALQITSGGVAPLDVEIVRIDVTYQPAEVIV